jgi:hypothetical protein
MHVRFCYYAIKSQISTKMIVENMFCTKTLHLPIVLPPKSRLVQLQMYVAVVSPLVCYLLRHGLLIRLTVD